MTYIKNYVILSIGVVGVLLSLTWACLRFWSMRKTLKTGSLSGKNRMSRGMGILTLLKKTASSPNGTVKPYLSEEAKLLHQRGHSSTSKRIFKKTQSSPQYLYKEAPTGHGVKVHYGQEQWDTHRK